jgi:hypothetical protein
LNFHGFKHDGLNQDFVAIKIEVMLLQLGQLTLALSLRALGTQVTPVIYSVTLGPAFGLFNQVNRTSERPNLNL